MARVSLNPPQIWEEPPMKVAAKYGFSAVFRFVIGPVLVLLSSTFAICQATPRDFHFASSDQTTVALSEESIFEATINGKGPFKLFFDTGANECRLDI